jgi:hypothetical protein
MKKLLLLLLICSVAEANPKYRLRVKTVRNNNVVDTLGYFPQVKKYVPGFYFIKHWVDISNQPIHDKKLAEDLIREVQLVDETIRQTQIINIRIK